MEIEERIAALEHKIELLIRRQEIQTTAMEEATKILRLLVEDTYGPLA